MGNMMLHVLGDIYNRPDQEMYKWSDQLLPKGKVASTPFEDYKKFRSKK